jgi:hypothetical protein
VAGTLWDVTARHARREAQAVVGDALFARVLEPSPSPSVLAAPWFADDPVREAPPDGRPVVGPVAGPDVALTWDAWLRDHPSHTPWASARWLGARPSLPAPPPTWSPGQRRALHALAAGVVSPARAQVNGKIGLRWTLGGFGTPFFGDEQRQVRVDATGVVTQAGDDDVRVDPLPPGVDPDAVTWVGAFFGFAWSVLETLRADLAVPGDVRVQLWPEHFDAALAAEPATYGFSPGDGDVEEPYLYVSLWDAALAMRSPGLWNATHFPGAIIAARDVLTVDAGLAWLRERRDAITRP